MPPRKAKAGGSSSSKKDEIQVSKSPAEFFAENQSIAGFDNPVSCGTMCFVYGTYFDVQVILTTTLSHV
jgi:hypothetical protein